MLRPPQATWDLAVCYLNHAGFAVLAPEDAAVVVDPFLSPAFRWQGHLERQLDPPPWRAQDIAPCRAIAITHDHADHFDVETCRAILAGNAGALLVGPAGVIAQARQAGLPAGEFVVGVPGRTCDLGALVILPLPNRGNERDRPCPRFSYLLRSRGGRSVFHSGDSHGPSESWRGMVEQPDLALLWPSQIEDTIAHIAPRRVWLMHWGRFEPGKFLCNVDAQALAKRLRERFPQPEIIASPPGSWLTLR